jgi:hypothetical protein
VGCKTLIVQRHKSDIPKNNWQCGKTFTNWWPNKNKVLSAFKLSFHPTMKYIPHLLLLASLVSARPGCKCTYGEPCWPSKSAFQELASKISQPLLHPRPSEAACYATSNSSGDCAKVQDNKFNSYWRSTQPGAMQMPNWQAHTYPNGSISTCYLNTTLEQPCEQGGIPVVGVDVRSVADAQAAIKFAAKNRLRLVIKNTG